ncbi:MAG: hypothetical protein AAFV90_26520 [Cyanobacteria bacterium J06634_5]
MYNRSRYGRNNWYMAFFWTFIGFVLGQLSPQISFSLGDRAQLSPPTQNTSVQNNKIAKTGAY